MTKLKLHSSLSIFLLIFVAHLARADETLILSPGRTTEWKAPRGELVSVSNGAIVRVRDLGASIKITALRKGSALIRSGSKGLQIYVMAERSFRLYQALKSHLFKRRGLELTSDGIRVRVTGQLLRLEDWTELASIASSSGEKFAFAAEMNDGVRKQAERYFKGLLRSSQLPDLAVSFFPEATITVPRQPDELKSQLEKLLGPYGMMVSASPSALSLEPLVRVRIVVAEFRKHMMSRIGLKWPEAVTAQLIPAFDLSNSTAANLTLNALEENGLGRILASPTLLCRSGKEAEFLAGGEIPIKIANLKAHDVTWKKYGILLRIRPIADQSGRMSIGLETEVSMLDVAHTVDGIPGFLTNRIESHFDLTSARTIALSGLIKKDWGEANSGLPSLANLPVFGALFGSREYRDDQTELVVFVTPEIANEANL